MPADRLISRLDAFAIQLLDDAEAQPCGAPQSSDTSEASEEGPGQRIAPVSLSERVAVLKACTSYLQSRDKRTGGGAGKTPDEPDEAEEPEIVSFERSIKRGNRRTVGR